MTQLVRRGPGWPLEEFERDMDQLLGRAVGSRLYPILVRDDRWVPPCDVFPRDGGLLVRLELPGIDPATDVQVTAENGVLCIHGERKHEDVTGQTGYYYRERRFGRFERSVPLPDEVKLEEITATYRDGVLEIVVPMVAVTRPTRIPIDTGDGAKALGAGQTVA